MENEEQIGARRRVLAMGASWLAASIGALAFIPGVAFLLDPLRRKSKSGADWRDMGALDGLSSKEPKAYPVVGEQVDAWTRAPKQRLGTVWLQLAPDNNVRALSAECPHLGCQIGFDAAESRYVCPCHRSGFNIEGEVLYGPSPRPLDALEARVDKGRVQVRFQRFQPQVKRKIAIG